MRVVASRFVYGVTCLFVWGEKGDRGFKVIRGFKVVKDIKVFLTAPTLVYSYLKNSAT